MARPAPPEPEQQRKPGRPRDPEADEAIIDATMQVLCEHGFGGLTVDAVATRAKVGKATIYRRWPSKARLALHAAASVLPTPETPDTGNLRDDLVELFVRSHFERELDVHQRLMAAIFAEAVVNEEVRDVLREFVEARRSTTKHLLARARERGEIRTDADTGLLLDLISGTLMYQAMLRGKDLTRRRVEKVVDAALRATT